jgi:hypothetical protein
MPKLIDRKQDALSVERSVTAGNVVMTIHGFMDSPVLGSTGNRKAVLTYAQAKAFAYRLLAEIAEIEAGGGEQSDSN